MALNRLVGTLPCAGTFGASTVYVQQKDIGGGYFSARSDVFSGANINIKDDVSGCGLQKNQKPSPKALRNAKHSEKSEGFLCSWGARIAKQFFAGEVCFFCNQKGRSPG